MRLPAIELLRAAYGQYALGAFNVCNLEQIHGAFRGASLAGAPIIVQFTRAIRDYADPRMLEQMLRGAAAIYPQVVFAVHLDHGDEASCLEGIATGYYGSVMIDASHLPFEENIAATRRVVNQAHARGLAVEAELGQLKGIEDEMTAEVKSAILTDPSRAREFVERSGCDFLAVAIGTSHGAYKFAGDQCLDLGRLDAIRREIPGVPLVLHGGSAVPAEEVRRINAAGGEMAGGARGVAESDLRVATRGGITKVNIGTDGRLLWTRVHREFFRDHPGEFDFMAPGRIYVDEYAKFVVAKCQLLGSSGKALATQNSS
jgi:fructose-bisphosphate aldolase class II